MRKLFERLRQAIEDFIEQRDDLLMLASCHSDDLPVILKTLRDIEQATATDVFLLFIDKFVEPGPFVSVAVERLKEEHRMACEGLAEAGQAPLPPVPEALDDEALPPPARLRDAISFARSLVPREGGHRLVWAMFPEEIADRRAYLRLVASFVPWEGVQPWMRGVRLIFRDGPDTEQYAPELVEAPRLRRTIIDLSTTAITASFEGDVENEELSEAERMQALLSLACMDYAYNRTADAIAKYEVLLGYYQHTDNHLMQAFVMNGLGDVYGQRLSDLEKAQYWYECAVPPAVTTQDPGMLATIVKNLGDLAYKCKQYAEAEQYFDHLDKLRGHLLDPEGKVQALEWRGLSQEQQQAYGRAVESWDAAALLCRNIGLPGLLRMNLEHLQRVYRRLRMRDKLATVQAEVQELARQEET
jgi:tetratricopeptide (TPR) repeat protein